MLGSCRVWYTVGLVVHRQPCPPKVAYCLAQTTHGPKISYSVFRLGQLFRNEMSSTRCDRVQGFIEEICGMLLHPSLLLQMSTTVDGQHKLVDWFQKAPVPTLVRLCAAGSTVEQLSFACQPCVAFPVNDMKGLREVHFVLFWTWCQLVVLSEYKMWKLIVTDGREPS